MDKITQILTGWIQNDPELRYTPSGKAVFTFTISCPAGTKTVKDSNKPQNAYTYVRCTAWGQLAEDMNDNYRDKDLVTVKGYLRLGEPWVDKNKETRHTIEFTVFSAEHIK